MSNRQVLVKAFNRLFLEFLNDLLDVFPENQDIRQGKQYVELLKGMNPSMVVKCLVFLLQQISSRNRRRRYI